MATLTYKTPFHLLQKKLWGPGACMIYMIPLTLSDDGYDSYRDLLRTFNPIYSCGAH